MIESVQKTSSEIALPITKILQRTILTSYNQIAEGTFLPITTNLQREHSYQLQPNCRGNILTNYNQIAEEQSYNYNQIAREQSWDKIF